MKRYRCMHDIETLCHEQGRQLLLVWFLNYLPLTKFHIVNRVLAITPKTYGIYLWNFTGACMTLRRCVKNKEDNSCLFGFWTICPWQFHKVNRVRAITPKTYGIYLWNLTDACMTLKRCVKNKEDNSCLFGFWTICPWQFHIVNHVRAITPKTYGIYLWNFTGACMTLRRCVKNKEDNSCLFGFWTICPWQFHIVNRVRAITPKTYGIYLWNFTGACMTLRRCVKNKEDNSCLFGFWTICPWQFHIVNRVRAITPKPYGIYLWNFTGACMTLRRCVMKKEGNSCLFGFWIICPWLSSIY